mmetsp:Transcript_11174/g.27469  ORF Transcript_11174/g.27469 Transcript_11174/m.27469 type:complete len:266 (+) Transcript_11174:66-863(+)
MTGSPSATSHEVNSNQSLNQWSLSLFLNIIDSRHWNVLEYAMGNDPRAFQIFARTIMHSSDLNGMTLLHACVRFDPPTHIVKLLLDLVPESPGRIDCLQRTPLHVAAGTRASLPTIQLLARAYPQACAIQDEDGRTPLHLACDSSCKLFEGDDREESASASSKDVPSYEVVNTLMEASPSSAIPLLDHDDVSALKYAISSNAPIKVVRLLQHATRKECERNYAQQIQIQQQHHQQQNATGLGMTRLTRRVSPNPQDFVQTMFPWM